MENEIYVCMYVKSDFKDITSIFGINKLTVYSFHKGIFKSF